MDNEHPLFVRCNRHGGLLLNLMCTTQCNQSRAQNQMMRKAEECGYVDILPHSLSVKSGSLCHHMDFSPTYPLLWQSYPQLSTSYPRTYPPKIGPESQNWSHSSMMERGNPRLGDLRT